MLKAPHPGAYNLATTLHKHAEAPMPHYEYFCNACKKTFSKVLTLGEYEEGEVRCPLCGSDNVEQSWSVFYPITPKKSA
jgi:putative FmdB family regulatory protein